MDTGDAVSEFLGILRLGTTAIREIISKDETLGPSLEDDINQLLYLVDSIEEIGDSIRSKTQSTRRGSSTM